MPDEGSCLRSSSSQALLDDYKLISLVAKCLSRV